jgi:GT2 family glycosyltransferase
MDRWPLIKKAVESARGQTAAVDAVVLCIDNNDELLRRAQEEWGEVSGTPVKVLPNRHTAHLAGRDYHEKTHGTARRFGAGSARNTAAETVTSDIVAFMDDDAWAEPHWIEQLLTLYRDRSVKAVGGAPLPDYETGRPAWFPGNFDWVFGCAYEGLPTEPAPLRRLIGANMSVRREALEAIGGFHVNDFDDLDLCMRVAARYGDDCIYYNPRAVVHHYVPAARVTWRYFWRRCFFVNRRKVSAFRGMGEAGNLIAERHFVIGALRHQLVRGVKRGLRGDPQALVALGAMIAGIALAGAGHLRGQLDQLRSSRQG